MNQNEPFVIERVYNAPVEKVWKALTDKSYMKQWYFSIAEFEPVVGFEFQFEGSNEGRTFLHRCKITEVVENKKLVFTNIALDDKDTHLLEGVTTVTFDDVGGKTKLTVHTGAAGTAPGVEQMLGGMEQGWNEQLDKLNAFVAKEMAGHM